MANIKTELFVVCEAAVSDKTTNNLSIFNIFDNINSSGFPTSYPKLAVVVNFSVAVPTSMKCLLVIRNPEGLEIIKTNDATVQTVSSHQKIQFLNNFINTVFATEGKYAIEFHVNGEKIDEIVLDVKKI